MARFLGGSEVGFEMVKNKVAGPFGANEKRPRSS